jgi:hypothetical protein
LRYWHFRLFRHSPTIMAADMAVVAVADMAVVAVAGMAVAGIMVVTVAAGELDPR